MGSGAGAIGVGSPDGPGFAIPPLTPPPTTAEIEEAAPPPETDDGAPATPSDTFARAAGAAGLPTTATVGLPMVGLIVGIRPLDTELATQLGGYFTVRLRDFSVASAMLRTGDATHASLRLTSRSTHVVATLDTSPAAQDVRIDVGSTVEGVSFNLSAGVHAVAGEAPVDSDSVWLSVLLPTTTFDFGAAGSLIRPERIALWGNLSQQIVPNLTLTGGANGSDAGVSGHVGLVTAVHRSPETGTVSLNASVGYDGSTSTPSVTVALTAPGAFAISAGLRLGSEPGGELRLTLY